MSQETKKKRKNFSTNQNQSFTNKNQTNMKSIPFKEMTNKIAEHQEQFNTVHVQRQINDGSVNMCFEFTDEEIAEIVRTKKIWYKQVTGKRQMNPVLLTPFKEHIIEEEPLAIRVCEHVPGQLCENKVVELHNHKFCCQKGLNYYLKLIEEKAEKEVSKIKTN